MTIRGKNIKSMVMISGVFFFSLILKAEVISSQWTKVFFEYDAAGNRITRGVHQEVNESDSLAIDVGEIIVEPIITTGNVTVRTTTDLTHSSLNYTMSNMTGHCVGEGSLVNQNTQLEIPATNGVYILNVSSKTNSKTFKIVKK